ncbi:MAG: D-amino-acid transaminase [Rhizobiaceae bacterium]
MSRTVYVNGDFLREEDARISVFDRGFLFADGVYEVTSVLRGKLVDNGAHLARLRRSLCELKLDFQKSDAEIEAIQLEMVRRNNLVEGALYLQVSRGVADRDFAFPANPVPSMVLFTQEKNLAENPAVHRGFSVVTMPDIRWRRRDIKTVQLLAPSIAKQAAMDAGADDAWLVEDGFVTEGTSNNAWIIKGGAIITRQLSNDILHGITRKAVLRLAAEDGLRIEERAFTADEAKDADEAFVTSATTFVMPVVSIDGKLIGNGNPGTLTLRLRQLYIEEALKA